MKVAEPTWQRPIKYFSVNSHYILENEAQIVLFYITLRIKYSYKAFTYISLCTVAFIKLSST